MSKKFFFILILVCLIFTSCDSDILHTHEFDNGVVTLEPTCESVGIKTYTCQCGEEKKEVLARLEHTAGELETTKASCSKEGKATVKCTKCGKILQEKTEEALIHEWNEGVVVNEATCASIGSKKFTCKNCGAERLETTTKLEHVKSEEKTRDATCTQKGGTYTECTVCGEIISDGDIPALGHDWGDGVVINEPTCISIGSRKFTCSRCREEKIEVLAKVDHNESSQKTKAATCTEKGSVYTECTVCGKVLSTVSETKALGHSWNDGVVVEEATCESIGSKKFTCTRTGCGAEKLETTAKLDHTVQTVTTPATCTEKGKEETKCSVCGEVVHSTSLAAKGHTWNAGEVKIAATCSSIGSREYTCIDCSETKLETIAKLEHVVGEEKTENATCTEAGRTYTQCTLCNKIINSTSIAPKGHTWVFKERTLEPTCENEGTDVYKCSVCNEEETRSVAKLGHSFTGKVETIPATCTAEGSKFGHCIRCDQTTYEAIAKIAHTENEGVVTTAPTCTATGIKTYSCSVCGAELSAETVAVTGHTKSSSPSYNKCSEPGCTTDGCYVYDCENCGIEMERQTISKWGHDLQETSRTAATCTVAEVINYKCSRCTYTTTETGATNSSNHAGNTTWTVTTEAKYFTKGTETEYCTDCTSATGSTREVAYKDLTGFWEGTDANGFITYSFAEGKVVIGQISADDVYSESEAYSYSVSDGKLTITIDESDKELTCTSETSSTITLSDAAVEFTLTRKTTAAHTHAYNSWTASGNVNANNELITVYHYRLTNCTEHSTLSFHGEHTYGESHCSGDGATCTVCNGPEYFKVQNDTDNGSFYYVAGGGSITLPALPSGYNVWTINIPDMSAFQTVEVEKAAGVSFSPTAAENCSLMSVGYPTGGIGGAVLFTTDPSVGGSAMYVFCAKRKCSKCGLSYTEDYCPTCTPKVGDIKEYGKYPDDYDIESLRGKAIEWTVISVDAANSRALVMSVNVLEKRVFSTQKAYYYASSIKTYLTGSTETGFIATYGLGSVSMCGVNTNTKDSEETVMSNYSSEKVFLLSETEMRNYFGSSSSSTKVAYYDGVATAWWLRTAKSGACWYFVTTAGGVNTGGNNYNQELGLRPAFWVNY